MLAEEELHVPTSGGVLKTGWLDKWLHRVPAAVLLLVRVDQQQNWPATLNAAVAEVAELRRRLRGRPTRLLIAACAPPQQHSRLWRAASPSRASERASERETERH